MSLTLSIKFVKNVDKWLLIRGCLQLRNFTLKIYFELVLAQ